MKSNSFHTLRLHTASAPIIRISSSIQWFNSALSLLPSLIKSYTTHRDYVHSERESILDCCCCPIRLTWGPAARVVEQLAVFSTTRALIHFLQAPSRPTNPSKCSDFVLQLLLNEAAPFLPTSTLPHSLLMHFRTDGRTELCSFRSVYCGVVSLCFLVEPSSNVKLVERREGPFVSIKHYCDQMMFDPPRLSLLQLKSQLATLLHLLSFQLVDWDFPWCSGIPWNIT